MAKTITKQKQLHSTDKNMFLKIFKLWSNAKGHENHTQP
jgi:hypothetical protein